MNTYDCIIIGAGAGGLFAAAQLYKRGKRALIIDMGDTPARKVAVSGGGKCNFTNMAADWTHYVGQNPRFVMSGLAQWSPKDTLSWVKSHGIKYYEKEPGRFFCADSANDIINALIRDIGNTKIQSNTMVKEVVKNNDTFTVKTDHGDFSAHKIIIATGGLSWGHLGVSDTGMIIAKKFGHKIEPIRPALCAMKTGAFSSELSGISLPIEITIGKNVIKDDLLFTHFGIGGPATYRASLFGGGKMTINFAPNIDVFTVLKTAKHEQGRKSCTTILSEILPNKFARFICNDTRNIADYKDTEIQQIVTRINKCKIDDARAIGLTSAEVTAGGVSTADISSKTMESKLCDGLYFVGEVMDITGDLGGFNIQWALSSAFVAGNCV